MNSFYPLILTKRIRVCIRVNFAWLIFSTSICTTAAMTAVKIPVKNTTSHRLMNFNVVSFCKKILDKYSAVSL